jgi:hypothetical protein
MNIKQKPIRFFGEGGVPQDPLHKDACAAIIFALKIDDRYEACDFLDAWLHGDTKEWPEFDGSRDCKPDQ